jgi:hypothetical protein
VIGSGNTTHSSINLGGFARLWPLPRGVFAPGIALPITYSCFKCFLLNRVDIQKTRGRHFARMDRLVVATERIHLSIKAVCPRGGLAPIIALPMISGCFDCLFLNKADIRKTCGCHLLEWGRLVVATQHILLSIWVVWLVWAPS